MRIYKISDGIDMASGFWDDYIDPDDPFYDLPSIFADELAKKRLGDALKSVDYVSPNGREAGGKCICNCGEESKWRACADVGGVIIYCKKCGMIDV